MSRESFVFVLGFIVFFTSFLGIPGDWKRLIFIVSGVLLMLFGYNLRRTAFLRSIETGTGERRGDSFVESAAARKTEEKTEGKED
jgi:uncharacterized membrane protein